MKKIGVRELGIMQGVLRMPDQPHKLNKTLQWLSDEYGIGHIAKGEVSYTKSCIAALRKLHQRHSNIDENCELTTGGSRIDQARQALNEKSGAQAVFAGMLWVKSAQRIPLANGTAMEAPLSSQAFQAVDISELDFNLIERIIIIENGSMLRYLQNWLPYLPAVWRNALMVYRGHDVSMAAVNDMLASLPGHIQVAVYADFDLGGLRIIQGYLKYRSLGFFVPEHWDRIDRNYQDSNELEFVRQSLSIKPNFRYANLQKVAEHIVKNRVAVMQEKFDNTGALVYLNAG